jgi:hypothetical protein
LHSCGDSLRSRSPGDTRPPYVGMIDPSSSAHPQIDCALVVIDLVGVGSPKNIQALSRQNAQR